MKPRLRDIFTFTTRERNGTIVLLVLIAGALAFMAVQKNFIHLPEENFAQFDSFLATLDKQSADSIPEQVAEAKSNIPRVSEEAGLHSVFQPKEHFYFNPNELSEHDWVRLGLSPAQARVVKNYEAKGGKFRTKEDVKKMFVISAELYAELEPFIVLPEEKAGNQQTANANESRRPMPAILELNTADSTDLVSIDGIGPVFARRILSYRERLGGFRSIEQLREVFGMDEEHFEKVRPSVTADSTYIRRINVPDLKKHPYFTPGVAQALVNYRKQHGPFRSVADIRGCVLVGADLYRKIAPYLTI
jgi:competence ComEA-like helix-hairpin-helix protein